MRTGLLSRGDVLKNGIRVMDYSRRNNVFKVVRSDDSGWLVKQAANRSIAGPAIEREARICEAINTQGSENDIAWLVPKFRLYDADEALVVTELVHPATALTMFHLNAGHPVFPVSMGRTIGVVLAALHSAGVERMEGTIPRTTPYNFDSSANFQAGVDAALSAVGRQVIDTIRARTTLHARADKYRSTWRYLAPLHGDFRWDNILITTGEGPRGLANVRLVDWELAHMGDPAWDVACAFSEYIRFWVANTGRAVPGRKHPPGTEHPTRADLRVVFQPGAFLASSQAFWSAYVTRAGLDPGAQRDLFARVVDYLPIALVRVCIEQLPNATEIPPSASAALDLAIESAQDGPAWARSFFGISEGQVVAS